MSSTQVSVVVIFLDGEAFLEEAIASVGLQTHSNWELLLVDDGSTDASARIAIRAARADPARVRYLQHPDGANHGTSASRNLGASHAAGAYLLFLDCDDLLLPTNLARHVAALDGDAELAAVFSPTLFWLWDRTYAADSDSIQSVGDFGDRRISAPDLLLAMLRDESLHPANCGTMFRRIVFESCGRFDESFRGMYEDTALLTKLLIGHPTYMIAECLSAYRAHPGSQCNASHASGEYDPSGPSVSRLRFLRWAQEYCRKLPMRDARVMHAIEREIQTYEGRRLSRSGAVIVRLARLATRIVRWTRRGVTKLRFGGNSDDHVAAAVDVMRRIRSTYVAMNRNREAAAITERIAELKVR